MDTKGEGIAIRISYSLSVTKNRASVQFAETVKIILEPLGAVFLFALLMNLSPSVSLNNIYVAMSCARQE